jgi:hypothetical protein
VYFLSFKKGGKIQTGLNCEYDGLSEACFKSLSHSKLLGKFSHSGQICLHWAAATLKGPAHRDIRAKNLPILYEDGPRAVMGVKK